MGDGASASEIRCPAPPAGENGGGISTCCCAPNCCAAPPPPPPPPPCCCCMLAPPAAAHAHSCTSPGRCYHWGMEVMQRSVHEEGGEKDGRQGQLERGERRAER
uniref:Uncharacterized protein n=1 Tax=Arundo donax TaxID=35708 RepID=A0A0A9F4P4_ARUDO